MDETFKSGRTLARRCRAEGSDSYKHYARRERNPLTPLITRGLSSPVRVDPVLTVGDARAGSLMYGLWDVAKCVTEVRTKNALVSVRTGALMLPERPTFTSFVRRPAISFLRSSHSAAAESLKNRAVAN